ncbi:MAG: flagellar basal-body rod protein FlgG [Pseudomonadota bacterium]
MISALNSAASGMEAQMAQIDSISNNLANVNTTGYKKSRAEFQDLLYETLQEPGANTSSQTQAPVGIQRGMGVKISGTQRNFEIGSPVSTSRDLDMMIRGEGFFMVQLPTGETGYKRDGSFFQSSTGRIETIDGYPLQPEITIPPNAKRVEITDDGTVWAIISETERQQLGQVQLASFLNNGGLKAMGKNIFLATEASGAANISVPNQAPVGGIMQRYLESSNVDVVREMTDMISTQRAFEMNSKVIQTVDQMLQNTTAIR